MKKALLLIALLIYFFALESCRKSDLPTLKAQLPGSWELRILYGSQVPGIGPDFPAGNGDIWKFSESTYQTYRSGQLSTSGTYAVTKISTSSNGVPEDALILDKDIISSAIHFSIAKDTLIMYVGIIAADGYIAKYVRQ